MASELGSNLVRAVSMLAEDMNTLIANTFKGRTATVAADIITGLNETNPLHWLANPLCLY